MKEAKKKNIAIDNRAFDGAKDKETCLEWAKAFLKSDRTLLEEVEEMQGMINNERLWQIGATEPGEWDLHTDNLQNYCTYMDWLQSLVSKEEMQPTMAGYCIVRLDDGRSNCYFTMGQDANVYTVASAYNRNGRNALGRCPLNELAQKFGNVVNWTEGAYKFLLKAMAEKSNAQAALHFDFQNGFLCICRNGSEEWKIYDLDAVYNAVEEAEEKEGLSFEQRTKLFEDSLDGQELYEDEIQGLIIKQ